jgi:hypothetical protein
VNQHFLHDDYPFIGMETYIDLEYIYANKQLWNSFIRSLKWLSFSGEYTKEEHETIGSLKVFIEQNFANNPMIYDITSAFNEQEKPIKNRDMENSF